MCGPENWYPTYEHLNGGVICTLSIRVDGKWVSKQDGAQETQVEPFKGGISAALKRAASVWGIGRYLYELPTSFVTLTEKKTNDANIITHNRKKYYWLPPELPKKFIPSCAEGGGAPIPKNNKTSHSVAKTKPAPPS